MKYMKIPNKAVIALTVVFLVVGLVALPLPVYGWRIVQFLAVLAIGFVLNLVGAIGAGDAKFAAAMAPFFAPEDPQLLLFLMAAVAMAAVVVHRAAGLVPAIRRITPDWLSWERKDDFPMGLALGGILGFYLIAGIIFGG